MYEWEVESWIVGKDLPDFDDKLKQAVFLTKFTAMTAKRILLVAKDSGIDAKLLLDGVEEWIKELNGDKVKDLKAGV